MLHASRCTCTGCPPKPAVISALVCAGYALSIFIPISFVCVLPYEAVRWAMIGVATVSSGLFLLLNFKGPIFDVAGAK